MSSSSKRRRGRQDDDDGGRGGDDKRSRRHRKKKHLYLVLDDWDKGYSIHKIVIMDSSDDDEERRRHRGRLISPVLRVESPAGRVPPHPGTSFAALGTKILAHTKDGRSALVYDVETGVLGVGARTPLHMVCCSGGVSVAVGGALYALIMHHPSDHHHPAAHLEAMSWRDASSDSDADAVPPPPHHRPTGGWSWKAMPPPPPEFRSAVSSYALHPDGRTIFMTTYTTHRRGTYSFDTEESKWRWHGEWALPFHGQAHYDADLDAWVGLASIKAGHICCCRPVSPTYYNERAPTGFLPDFKTTKEKLFGKDPRRGHMTPCLTYMGGGASSMFCLVECMLSKRLTHDDEDKPAWGDDDGFVLHVTVFGLRYDHKGELQTTRRRSTRSFSVPRHSYLFSPFAFWM